MSDHTSTDGFGPESRYGRSTLPVPPEGSRDLSKVGPQPLTGGCSDRGTRGMRCFVPCSRRRSRRDSESRYGSGEDGPQRTSRRFRTFLLFQTGPLHSLGNDRPDTRTKSKICWGFPSVRSRSNIYSFDSVYGTKATYLFPRALRHRVVVRTKTHPLRRLGVVTDQLVCTSG